MKKIVKGKPIEIENSFSLQSTRYVPGESTSDKTQGLAISTPDERECSLTARTPKAGDDIGTRSGGTDPNVRWDVETLPDDGGIYRMLLKGGHDEKGIYHNQG